MARVARFSTEAWEIQVVRGPISVRPHRLRPLIHNLPSTTLRLQPYRYRAFSLPQLVFEAAVAMGPNFWIR